MKVPKRKILLTALLLLIGVPVLSITALVSWIKLSDHTNGTVVSSGETRRYLLYVPKTYDRSKPTPLVISFHPAASWPAAEKNVSQWNDLADERGFIVAYPAGSGSPGVWRTKSSHSDLDVKFVSDLIDKLEREYNIDPARIYLNGYSQGGGITFVLSCRLSGRIAAVGAVAAALELPFSSCNDPTPVPMIEFHGTDDFVHYHGGKSPDPFNPVNFPDIRGWAADWARRNQCTSGPVEVPVASHVDRMSYTHCAANANVVLYTIRGGGHTWPGGANFPAWFVGTAINEVNATRLMWEFFQQHPRTKTQ